MQHTKKQSAFFALLLSGGLLLGGCQVQDVYPRDARIDEMAGVNTIALAQVSARPSESIDVFSGSQGELVTVLSRFETELANAFINSGLNVVNPASSQGVFSRSTDYEEIYTRLEPSLANRARNDEEIAWYARRLKERLPVTANKPSAELTSAIASDSWRDLTVVDNNRSPLTLKRQWERVPSMNTRLYAQIGAPGFVTLPRNTDTGGALDERFASNAARKAIGQLAAQAGADAYLIIDGAIILSPREEGMWLSGLTGGTRFVTYEGVAMLVKNDGRILSIDRVRAESDIPIGGRTQDNFNTEHGRGPFGMYARPELDNLREASYQAVRRAALSIATHYAGYRGLESAPSQAEQPNFAVGQESDMAGQASALSTNGGMSSRQRDGL